MNTTVSTNTVLHIKDTTDVPNIALYDQATNQRIFTNLTFLDTVPVTDDKKLMEHPKEDGTMIVDHVVDDPIQIVIPVIIEDDDSTSLNELSDYYKNSTLLVAKIKNETYYNLVIAARPFKAEASHYDKTVYEITVKEIQEAVTQYVKMSVPQVKQKKNASTIKAGHKQAQPTPSIARKIYNFVTRRS